MKPSLLSRSLHKWLALFVGLQLLVWAVTGFFMVAVDLDFIHGDSLVRNLRTPVANAKAALPVAELTRRYPEVTFFSLHSLPVLSTPVYTDRGRSQSPGRCRERSAAVSALRRSDSPTRAQLLRG
jgi:hypothetical protein